MSPTFLTSLELADRWRVSPRTIEDWRRRRRPPHPVRIGRRVLYRLADVEALERAELARLSCATMAEFVGTVPGATGSQS
ncbi:helix-turn-helix domain-containing protein [Pararhodobacter sp. SW119]|uniref:helix-turn-helix domain-containing protein n=1 Tax=Pararhodobacter sp. SW119 TaxID=2780075 RepID=UPI001AE09763|nr:helix-turn-helix domain-containing protein [Pararhodobacter sp. SW119]